MTLAETYLAEFLHEAKTTRRFLERLPADKLAWRAHEKSRTAGQLALHIASVPGGVIQMAAADPARAPDFSRPNPQPATVEEILTAHDESVATVRNVLPTFTDVAMAATWRALGPDGKEVMVVPRAAFLRSILLNHWIQHRGQFGVYLRLVGAKVPTSYGPSGDEAPAFARA
jgi:uncharacterized damage-inducible protein DinB